MALNSGFGVHQPLQRRFFGRVIIGDITHTMSVATLFDAKDTSFYS